MQTIEKILLIGVVVVASVILYTVVHSYLGGGGVLEVTGTRCSNETSYVLIEVGVSCTGSCQLRGVKVFDTSGKEITPLWVLNDNTSIMSSAITVYIAVPVGGSPPRLVEIDSTGGKAVRRLEQCP